MSERMINSLLRNESTPSITSDLHGHVMRSNSGVARIAPHSKSKQDSMEIAVCTCQFNSLYFKIDFLIRKLSALLIVGPLHSIQRWWLNQP